jgi:hypothetical protein
MTLPSYEMNRYPNSYLTRNSGQMQGNFTPMNAQTELVSMNIYQLIITHKEREKMKEVGNDNINFFTIIAEQIGDVIPLFDEWYYSWSQSGIPYENYNIQVNMVMHNIQSRQKGVIQFSYRW